MVSTLERVRHSDPDIDEDKTTSDLPQSEEAVVMVERFLKKSPPPQKSTQTSQLSCQEWKQFSEEINLKYEEWLGWYANHPRHGRIPVRFTCVNFTLAITFDLIAGQGWALTPWVDPKELKSEHFISLTAYQNLTHSNNSYKV